MLSCFHNYRTKAIDVLFRAADVTLTFAQAQKACQQLSETLAQLHGQSVALKLDNSLPWLLCDLALSATTKVAIPLPAFFSDEQVAHAIQQSGASWLLADDEINDKQATKTLNVCGEVLHLYEMEDAGPVEYFPNTQKVTFTSGSTGTPKGVCLSWQNQLQVAKSLAQVITLSQPKHLCLLPLAVLLENIAGVYAPLLRGGCVEVVALSELGLYGQSTHHPNKLLNAITAAQPNSLIVVPELLRFLCQAVGTGWLPPSSLKFIAVGGAKVDVSLLHRAAKLGLPVFQGYGLSEAGSVVALNTAGQDGNVGQPLPHIEYRVVDSELYLRGNNFLGYLGDKAMAPEQWLATGDRVSVTENGLRIEGRVKNLIINSFGRNIAPEWPESVLLSHGEVLQCMVVGEGQPYLSALLYVAASMSAADIEQLLESVNATLPDYAHIKSYIRLNQPFSLENGLLTANGRIKRQAILHHYQSAIAALYGTQQALPLQPESFLHI